MQTSEHSSEQDTSLPLEMAFQTAPAEVSQATYSIIEFNPGQIPKEYFGYISAQWLHSARYRNPVYKRIPSHIYYKTYAKYVENILNHSKVRLAVLDEDNDVILGFSCYSREILHYVYVAREQRRQGIGNHLLPSEVKIYTHFTEDGERIVKTKKLELIFNPFV